MTDHTDDLGAPAPSTITGLTDASKAFRKMPAGGTAYLTDPALAPRSEVEAEPDGD